MAPHIKSEIGWKHLHLLDFIGEAGIYTIQTYIRKQKSGSTMGGKLENYGTVPEDRGTYGSRMDTNQVVDTDI